MGTLERLHQQELRNLMEKGQTIWEGQWLLTASEESKSKDGSPARRCRDHEAAF